MGYIFGADYTMLACLLHCLAAKPDESCTRKTPTEASDDFGAVVIA